MLSKLSFAQVFSNFLIEVNTYMEGKPGGVTTVNSNRDQDQLVATP
jgi:hypothetical protein